MTNKSQAAYTHVFRYIDNKICSMDCESFITDYETAMRNAIQMCYPDSKVYSCWFHFSQAVKKKMSQLPDLNTLIRTKKEVYCLYRKFQALPLLPPANIEETFKQLSEIAMKKSSVEFMPFLNYYEKQWIKKVIVTVFPN